MKNRAGFSPHQWVIGHNPRIPGSAIDDDELGYLGVYQRQTDYGTEFGRRAAMRKTARQKKSDEDTTTEVLRLKRSRRQVGAGTAQIF